MPGRISVPLPINMSDQESSLYSPYRHYQHPVQKIKTFKNVLITFSGFCINKDGIIKESHHRYPRQYDDYLRQAAYHYNDIIEHPENLITLDDDATYLAIHHPWFNYYHWICEAIFRLWLVREQLDQLTLVLPKFYANEDFIMTSLAPFKITKIHYIPSGKNLLVKSLVIPQIKPICDSYNAKHLLQIRKFYREYLADAASQTPKSDNRLYVSRKFATRRKVVNEDDILKVLARFNFMVFYPEKHSFLEQVAVFSNVKYLVGEHGSGLTNLLFMDSGTSVLELHKSKTNELEHPSFLFWYMAAALGIDYYHQICDTHGIDDYFTGDYWIDPKLLEQNLVKMIEKRES